MFQKSIRGKCVGADARIRPRVDASIDPYGPLQKGCYTQLALVDFFLVSL